MLMSEKQQALEILNKLLKKYDIPNKVAADGIAKINGMPVEEYFNKVGLFDEHIDSIDVEAEFTEKTTDSHSVECESDDTVYDDDVDYIIAA